jgi:hypothetical protein
MFMRIFKILLSESKMQLGGSLTPSSLASPLEILKDIKIKKLSDFNFLTKNTS